MERYGLLVSYDFCCGCHTCEVACEKEHGFAIGEGGVRVQQVGPYVPQGQKKPVYDCMPMLTARCDLCAERIAKGKQPSCVKHCQTGCMRYGTVVELTAAIDRPDKYALLIP